MWLCLVFGAGIGLKNYFCISFNLKEYPELKKINELAKNGLILMSLQKGTQEVLFALPEALMGIIEVGPDRENHWQKTMKTLGDQ